MRLARVFLLGLLSLMIASQAIAENISTFLPSQYTYTVDIPTPDKVLGFSIGERHPRHDQVLAYVETLAKHAKRVKLTEIGRTNELRKQVILTISSEENLANIDEILSNRRNAQQQAFSDKKPKQSKQPAVVWLGYSIHGDEASGTSAAMVVAYHLAASKEQSVTELLKNTIIVIDPSMNPDGMDRFVTWNNALRGSALNSDPNHAEHHQGWLTGRTNHFGFDLNRDWLLLTQKESQNRVKYFHHYMPNVFGDFHEMAAHKTYFFQPGIPSRTHPLTPLKNTELTQLLATYHAKALDEKQRLYFSEENFDDFYYGKGSTYPDVNGAVGILFEQAGTKGMQQQTENGLLTFAFGIENHVAVSLSTIEGASKEHAALNEYQKGFYTKAKKAAEDDDTIGYIVSEKDDPYRLGLFLNTLKQHQIKAFNLTENFTLNAHKYTQDNSYFIPLEQPQYKLIKALFNQDKTFSDNTFYDVSGWTMPLAMNIHFEEVTQTWGLKTSATPWEKPEHINMSVSDNGYAYVFSWDHYLAPKLLNTLLQKNLKARVATKPFTAVINNEVHTFKAGSIVIPAGIQQTSSWKKTLTNAANSVQIPLVPLHTGLSHSGIDIGSISLKPVHAPRLLLVAGQGVSEYEIADMRFYIDDMLNIPVSIVEKRRLASIQINNYSHIVMVNGDYSDISTGVSRKLDTWVADGGVIFAQKRAAKWLSDKDLLQVTFASKNQIDQMYDTDQLSYKDKEALAARKRISGAIFASELDLSHPLAFGFNQVVLPLFKNSTLIMNPPKQPFMSVAKYTQSPLMSGFTDRNLVNKIANNTAVAAHDYGKGRVIASSENLAFRGYWHGASKLIANSIFFPKTFSVTLAE